MKTARCRSALQNDKLDFVPLITKRCTCAFDGCGGKLDFNLPKSYKGVDGTEKKFARWTRVWTYETDKRDVKIYVSDETVSRKAVLIPKYCTLLPASNASHTNANAHTK